MINTLKNYLKKNLKESVPLLIAVTIGTIGILILAVMMEFKYHRLEVSMENNAKAYEDAYLHHSHPHDPVSQTNLDLEVQQVQNKELSIE